MTERKIPETFDSDSYDPIRILILEDVLTDAELVEHELREAGIAFVSKRVETGEAFEKELLDFSPHLILSDYNLPSYDGLSALKVARRKTPFVPFIIVSGALGEETAVDMLQKGATDYVLKNRLFRLGPSVFRALQEALNRKKHRETLQQQSLVLHILELLNQSIDLETAIKDILISIQEQVGIEAVGIRMWEGDKFLYKETVGFPEEFIEANNLLCSPDITGDIVNDGQGQIYRECMCRNVIIGRTDPSLPFFTKTGSFWMNSMAQLLATTKEEDQGRTKNRCCSAGYESLALIPLRSGNYTTIGLLHLADRRPNCFSPEQIHFFEGLSASIGIALARQAALTLIRGSEARYRSIFNNAVEGLFQSTPEGKLLAVNPSLAQMYGYKNPEEMLGSIRSIENQMYVNPEDRDIFKRLLDERGVVKNFQVQSYKKDRTTMWVSLNVRSVLDDESNTLFYEGSAVDITERKLATEILNQEKQRFKTLTDHAPFGIMLIDHRGTIQYINPKFTEIFGYELSDIPTGSEWFKRAYPDPEYRHELTSSWIGGFQVPDMTKIFRTVSATCKDGSVKTVSIVGVKLENRAFLATCEDITQRVAFEKQLRETEERYRVAIDYSNDGVAIIKEDCPMYVNRKYLEIFGYDSADELVGKPVHLTVHPDDGMMVAEINRLRQEGKPVPSRYEFKGLKKDGGHIFLEVSAAQTSHLGDKVILAYMRDITERKKAEDVFTLQAQVLDQMHDAVVATDTDGIIIIWNSRAETLYGFPKEEAIGRHVSFIYPEEQFQQREREMMPQVRKLGTYQAETQMRKKSGEVFHVQVFMSLLKNAKKRTIGFIGYYIDITKNKELEDQLRHAQKMEAIGELAGGVAHDFNNLLSIMMGAESLIRHMAGEDSPILAYLDQIEASVQRGASLTRNLLSFSRKHSTQLAPLDLNETVRNTSRLLARLVTEDIELITEIGSGNLIILGDISQIDQILINLITNAKDAMPKGGTITLKTGSATFEETGVQSLSAPPGTLWAVITVTDTGFGMDEEVRNRIFDPFYTTKESGKGTGLGLSIVYGIVNQHKGHITATSKPGKGTTFAVYFPILGQDIQGEDSVQLEEHGWGKETILLAEDNAILRKLIKDVLADYGYIVIEAEDGQEAINLHQQHIEAVDMLLLDIGLPKKNGLEVYETIKATKPQIRTLFLSGHSFEILRQKGLTEDSINLIRKPFQIKDLLHKVRQILDAPEGH